MMMMIMMMMMMMSSGKRPCPLPAQATSHTLTTGSGVAVSSNRALAILGISPLFSDNVPSPSSAGPIMVNVLPDLGHDGRWGQMIVVVVVVVV